MSESSETSLMIEADVRFLQGSLHSASCFHWLAALPTLPPSLTPDIFHHPSIRPPNPHLNKPLCPLTSPPYLGGCTATGCVFLLHTRAC